ncbi:MAG: general stress protein [Solibacillus sp.]
MATMNAVENGVQAKTMIERFVSEGYDRDHIHVFANSNKRAEGIADFLNVDAGAAAETSGEETGFFASIKNFFQTTPDDFNSNLSKLGLSTLEIETAKKELDAGKLIIIAHHPQ